MGNEEKGKEERGACCSDWTEWTSLFFAFPFSLLSPFPFFTQHFNLLDRYQDAKCKMQKYLVICGSYLCIFHFAFFILPSCLAAAEPDPPAAPPEAIPVDGPPFRAA